MSTWTREHSKQLCADTLKRERSLLYLFKHHYCLYFQFLNQAHLLINGWRAILLLFSFYYICLCLMK